MVLATIVCLLTIVAFSCSSRGSDCNRGASSVSFPRHSLYFYCIFIVLHLYCTIASVTNSLNKNKINKIKNVKFVQVIEEIDLPA